MLNILLQWESYWALEHRGKRRHSQTLLRQAQRDKPRGLMHPAEHQPRREKQKERKVCWKTRHRRLLPTAGFNSSTCCLWLEDNYRRKALIIAELNYSRLLLRDYGSHSMHKIKIQVNYYLHLVSLQVASWHKQSPTSHPVGYNFCLTVPFF